MKLDCVSADRIGLDGWIVIDTTNGGVVSYATNDDCGFAWMKAAEVLAEALTDIERTIHNTHPQRFSTDKG